MGFVRFVATSIASAVVVAAALSGVVHMIVRRASHAGATSSHKVG